MSIMPGVSVRLIDRHNSGPRRPKGRGTSFHVTASAAASMFGYFSTVADCSHFHVAKDGTIEQYIDTDFYGAAQVDGNDMVTVETQGAAPGVNAETELWTPEQVVSNARIARWVHDVEGAPLVLMPDSRPGSRGVASHRLGIAPWRVAGGQVWSRVNGKVCPGSAKIAQLPQIIALAISGNTAAQEDELDANSIEYKNLLGTANNAAQIASEVRNLIVDPNAGILRQLASLAAAVAASRDDVDDKALAQLVIAGLAPQVAAAVGAAGGLSEQKMREITTEVVQGTFAKAAS